MFLKLSLFKSQHHLAFLYDDHDENFFILLSFPLYDHNLSLANVRLMMELHFLNLILFFYLIFFQIKLILNILGE